MIRLDSISKNYHNQVALTNINLHINEGEMAFLTGHSGAGKSTLLKLIMGIESASRGQIFVDDKNLTKLKRRQLPKLRRTISMIFQNPQLLPESSVFENVALPLIIDGYHRIEIERRVRAALNKVSLLHKEKVSPVTLSVGEQQRVGIARAIVTKPRLILADEPTGNLDPDLSREIMHLFEAFNAVGTTLLIATHDLTLIAPRNHRVITLKNGHLQHEAE